MRAVSARLLSAFQLCNYWSADQLVTQYPIMLALSVAVAAFASSASRVNLRTTLAAVNPHHKSPLPIGHHERRVV
ncbi:hypothetical protein ABW18_19875 [Gordonia jacobaea]|uniref:Secreted protein n=1 Tax=Gordonia jacobaea TaxID=122202 RepID=A0ABR5I7N9_9ACTN|nr:hypothetical protein ABW18_19875 [Gordonia jacobaea]